MIVCTGCVSLIEKMHIKDIPSRRAGCEMLLAWQVIPWRCRVEHLGRLWMRLSFELTRVVTLNVYAWLQMQTSKMFCLIALDVRWTAWQVAFAS